MRQKNYDADKTLKDIETFFESDEEDYYKPISTGNVFSSNYTKHESNGDKYNMLSIEDNLDNIESYVNNLIDDHKTQGEWKLQLTIAIDFILLKTLMKLVLSIQKVIT